MNDNYNHSRISEGVNDSLGREQKLVRVDNIIMLKDIIFEFNIFSKLFDINEKLPEELPTAFKTKDFNEIIALIKKLYPIDDDEDNQFFKEFI